MATWCEVDELFGAERTYCHLFFGLGDGGALAFFKFADPEDQELFGPKMPAHAVSPHRAERRQRKRSRRSRSAWQRPAYKPPHTYVLEHGYCRSVYVTDPEWIDPGVHPGPSARRDRSTRERAQTRTRSSSAGWLAITLEQHLSLDA